MENNQRNFIRLIIIFVIVLLVCCGVYIYTQKKQVGQPVVNFVTQTEKTTNQTTPTIPISNLTSGWETYKNNKYGFEIKHPKNYKTYSVKVEQIIHPDSISFYSSVPNGHSGDFESGFSINLPLSERYTYANPKANSLDDYSKDYITNDGYHIIIHSQQEVTVNNFKALKQIYSAPYKQDSNDEMHEDHTTRYIFYNGKQFIILNGDQMSKDYEKIFDQIALTFKFTN